MKKIQTVDEFMQEIDYPLKDEVNELRKIILAINPEIVEEVKWNAPSFSYKGAMVTFNMWAKDKVHLIFHNGAILHDTETVLEGNYKDRRMLYLLDMADVAAKKSALQALVREWIVLMDAKPPEEIMLPL